MRTPKKLRELPFPEPWEGCELIQWHVRVTQPVVNGERYLCVDFIENKGYKKEYAWRASPETFRLICSKKQNNYTLTVPKENELKPAKTLREMIGRIAHPTVVYPDISEREEAILRRWTGKESRNHQMETLCEWCDEAREKSLHAKRAARGELEDDDYILCPDTLPEGFEQWIRNEILPHDNTLVYKKGNIYGFCHMCGHKVRAWRNRFRQYAFTDCPNCGTGVVCVRQGSNAYLADYVENIAALQMGEDGQTLFIRLWHIRRDPSAEYKNIAERLEEFQRFAIRGDKVAKWLKEYKGGCFWGYRRYPRNNWERMKGTEVYDGSYVFYTGNTREEIQGTKLQYADIEGYITAPSKRDYKNVISFMLNFARYPVFEFLQKGGYSTLIDELITGVRKEHRAAFNKQGKTLQQCFKFLPRCLKLLPAEQWNIEKLSAMQWLSKRAERLNDEYTRIFLEEMPHTDRIERCLKYTSLKSLLKYLLKQERSGTRIPDISYSDYISGCEKLGLDLTSKEVLFPRDIHAAHARTMTQIKYEADAAKKAAFDSASENLKRLAYHSGELLIRPAKSPAELTYEGKTLHHCVAGYADRMAQGITAIFLIRLIDYPDNPYYTLELKNKEVIQCHTTHNKTCQEVGEPFIQTFVDEWLRKVVLKNSKSRTA